VADVTAGLTSPAVRGTPQGSYHFYPAACGYILRHGDRTVLEVDCPDLGIRLPRSSELPLESQLELYLRALAPKLLFQRGVTVLHSSACVAGEKLIAFAGMSGAGKTTTARAFASAGARLISEDLVVLAPRPQGAEVLTDGESFVQGWARNTGVQLLSEPQKTVPLGSLESVVNGETMPLHQILFLDPIRRAGTEFATSQLAEPDALISLMTHDFLGAVEAETWRRYFSRARALLEIVDFRDARTPDGLERLLSAVARYISRTAS
jgi:hypothetical protein